MSESEALRVEIAALRAQLEESAVNEQTQSKAFDALYDELKQYKEDFIFQAEKPLLLDLLLFYDSLNWFQESLVKREMSMDVISDSFQYLIDEFLEVLYRRDVLPMDSQPNFDPKTQKVVKVIPAEGPGQDQKVSQVLKRGFNRAERVLRSEEVVIYRDSGKSGS